MGCLFHFPKTTSKNHFLGERDLQFRSRQARVKLTASFLRNYPVDGVVEEAPWAAYGSTAQAKVLGLLFLRRKTTTPKCFFFFFVL